MIVLVHGVPETTALWDRLRTQLPADTRAVQLPGFGCPRPEGFAATPDAYAGWLIGDIERIGPPVDLVGHDWGAALTYRIATVRPDLLGSWAADAAHLLHPDYVWHDLARAWQTPDAGGAFWAGCLASPVDQAAAAFEPWGVDHDDALTLAGMADETMAGCVLDLYRAATPNPHARSRPARTAVPGLVLDAPADPFGPQSLSLEVAHLLGAEIAHLPGLGHWWAPAGPGPRRGRADRVLAVGRPASARSGRRSPGFVPAGSDHRGSPLVPAVRTVLPRCRGTAGRARSQGRPRHGVPVGAAVHPAVRRRCSPAAARCRRPVVRR